MLFHTNLSAGDFLDRLSILQIKRQHGLDVDAEMSAYLPQLEGLEPQGLSSFLQIMTSINSSLWDLEDKKRTSVSRGSKEAIVVSDLITHINDLRFQAKKRIDSYFDSDISEQKSHNLL